MIEFRFFDEQTGNYDTWHVAGIWYGQPQSLLPVCDDILDLQACVTYIPLWANHIPRWRVTKVLRRLVPIDSANLRQTDVIIDLWAHTGEEQCNAETANAASIS